MAQLGPLPLVLVGAVAAIAIASSGRAEASEGGEGGPAPGPGPGPGKPVLQGGEVVSRGFKSNAYGVKVSFQIERVAGGEFFGVIFEPWAQNNPAVVAQAETRDAARNATVAHIAADEHGSPG